MPSTTALPSRRRSRSRSESQSVKPLTQRLAILLAFVLSLPLLYGGGQNPAPVTLTYKLDQKHPEITRRYLGVQGMSRRARYFPSHAADADTVRRAQQHVAAVERALNGEIPGLTL